MLVGGGGSDSDPVGWWEMRGGRREEENEAVWWPPVAVMELARIAVDSGGDVGAIQRALDPAIIPVSLCCAYEDQRGFK